MILKRRELIKAGLSAGALVTAGVGPSALAGPADIIRRAIPSSGEKVPIIGLGTNRYGVGSADAERAPLEASLARFHERGGTIIDTAPMYRTSEAVLGDLIDELGIRKNLFVATKVDREGRDESDTQMHASFDKLKIETCDLMQVHNLHGWRESLPLIREWQQEGRIRYIGITTSRESQYEEMEQIMREHDLDFIQINYSLAQREAAERLLPLARDRNMGVIVNRAFGAGRIFQRLANESLPAWAADFDVTSWAQFLLKYVLSHPAVTLTIPGMTKTRHVDDNFGAALGRMPDAEERRRQEAFFDAL